MADNLIPGLRDPALAIVFYTIQDVMDLVTPRVESIPRYDPGKIAVCRRVA